MHSIPTENLRPLLTAIKGDFPGWDLSSEPLRVIFMNEKIDPKIKYSYFYSEKQPWMVVTYGWNNSKLDRLADICDTTDEDGNLLHRGKTIWIDVLMTRQFCTKDRPLNAQQVVKTQVYGRDVRRRTALPLSTWKWLIWHRMGRASSAERGARRSWRPPPAPRASPSPSPSCGRLGGCESEAECQGERLLQPHAVVKGRRHKAGHRRRCRNSQWLAPGRGRGSTPP